MESVGRPAESSQPAFHELDATNFARFRVFKRRFDSVTDDMGLEPVSNSEFRVCNSGLALWPLFVALSLRAMTRAQARL